VYKKPVILINYPAEIKAFYMKLNPDGKVRAAPRRCGARLRCYCCGVTAVAVRGSSTARFC
jgi:hypothetical protein